VSLNRVQRLMKENRIAARHKRKFRATTDSRHSLPVAPNLLGQHFVAKRPDQVWLADTSYVWTDQGWLYLACVLDLYSRAIVGWAMSERNDRHLVIAALTMACLRRRPPPGLIHHSDRGSTYCRHDYQKLLAQHGMLCSMSRKGDCYDNAPMESWFNSLKARLPDRMAGKDAGGRSIPQVPHPDRRLFRFSFWWRGRYRPRALSIAASKPPPSAR
jgi:putative transposase